MQGNLADEMIGMSNISLMRFFRKPFRPVTENMPLYISQTYGGMLKKIEGKVRWSVYVYLSGYVW